MRRDLQESEAWADVDAVKNGRVYVLPSLRRWIHDIRDRLECIRGADAGIHGEEFVREYIDTPVLYSVDICPCLALLQVAATSWVRASLRDRAR